MTFILAVQSPRPAIGGWDDRLSHVKKTTLALPIESRFSRADHGGCAYWETEDGRFALRGPQPKSNYVQGEGLPVVLSSKWTIALGLNGNIGEKGFLILNGLWDTPFDTLRAAVDALALALEAATV